MVVHDFIVNNVQCKCCTFILWVLFKSDQSLTENEDQVSLQIFDDSLICFIVCILCSLSCLHCVPATTALCLSLISQSTELNMGRPNQSCHDMVIIFKYCF